MGLFAFVFQHKFPVLVLDHGQMWNHMTSLLSCSRFYCYFCLSDRSCSTISTSFSVWKSQFFAVCSCIFSGLHFSLSERIVTCREYKGHRI